MSGLRPDPETSRGSLMTDRSGRTGSYAGLLSCAGLGLGRHVGPAARSGPGRTGYSLF
jgi:hypothetical protein